MLFFVCPKCHRHYAKGKGESLHDRWLSPLAIPLYGVIFEKDPVQFAPRIAESIQGQQSSEFIEMLLIDIEEELQHPKQHVSELHDFVYPNEQQLRNFLAVLALELRSLRKNP